jgi:AhpD family alkylhydroperoxidase
MAIVPVPSSVPWYLRPMLWVTRRMTGKDPLPARLLTYFPKGAIGVGLFELTAAGAPKDLDARCLAVARIVASAVAGCPFCVDMNAATWSRAGLKPDELALLFGDDEEAWTALGRREAAAARYAKALSLTPVVLSADLRAKLDAQFSPREIVVLAATIAQVNFWSRFNQGLGVPSAGFFDQSVCKLPDRLA